MRPFLAALLLMMSSFLTAAPLKLDHVGICGYDLESLQAAFGAIHLQAEYGGAHVTGGTHNALLGFDDGSYLELIALRKAGSATGDEAHRWKNLKPGMSRACFWAIHTDNLQALVDSFHRAKLEISDPRPGSRKKPDGTVLQWQTAAVPDNKGGDILPFAIQDITPRTSRIQPSDSVKGSELTGVKRVVIGVKDLNAAVALYRKAFGLGEPQFHTKGGVPAMKQAYFPGTPIILEQSWQGWGFDQVALFGEGPIAVLLGTRDINKTKRRAYVQDDGTLFGRKVMWFESVTAEKLHIGVIEE